MLREGRIEINGKGPFGVCFRSEFPTPWVSDEIGFCESEELIIFLIDSMLVHPQAASKAVVEAMTRRRSMTEKVVCSDLQLRRLFRPTISINVFRHAS